MFDRLTRFLTVDERKKVKNLDEKLKATELSKVEAINQATSTIEKLTLQLEVSEKILKEKTEAEQRLSLSLSESQLSVTKLKDEMKLNDEKWSHAMTETSNLLQAKISALQKEMDGILDSTKKEINQLRQKIASFASIVAENEDLKKQKQSLQSQLLNVTSSPLSLSKSEEKQSVNQNVTVNDTSIEPPPPIPDFTPTEEPVSDEIPPPPPGMDEEVPPVIFLLSVFFNSKFSLLLEMMMLRHLRQEWTILTHLRQ